MEALKADVTQGLSKGSLITCADNTGARELKVISGPATPAPRIATRRQVSATR